jgi:hypothetical protein
LNAHWEILVLSVELKEKMLAGEGLQLADACQFLSHLFAFAWGLRRIGLGRLPHAGVPEIVSRPKPIHLRVFVAALRFARAVCIRS